MAIKGPETDAAVATEIGETLADMAQPLGDGAEFTPDGAQESEISSLLGRSIEDIEAQSFQVADNGPTWRERLNGVREFLGNTEETIRQSRRAGGVAKEIYEGGKVVIEAGKSAMEKREQQKAFDLESKILSYRSSGLASLSKTEIKELQGALNDYAADKPGLKAELPGSVRVENGQNSIELKLALLTVKEAIEDNPTPAPR